MKKKLPPPRRFVWVAHRVSKNQAEAIKRDAIAFFEARVQQAKQDLARVKIAPLVLTKKVMVEVGPDDPRWDKAEHEYSQVAYHGEWKLMN